MASNNLKIFKILQFNANGLNKKSNLTQFKYISEKNSISVALVNETFFTNLCKTYFKKFDLYRNDKVIALGRRCGSSGT